MNNQLEIIVKESGLEETKAKTLLNKSAEETLRIIKGMLSKVGICLAP